MPAYDQQSMQDLADATQYESWFLEAAYAIAEESLFPEWPDKMIYPPDGSTPSHMAFGSGVISIGDWRPGFLRVGAPLIFVTTFKLLDMVVEWILGQDNEKSTYRFLEKIAALKRTPTFPLFVESRVWLKDRLIALYERLDPLRGTIVHARHFKTADGALDVSSSRGNHVGPTISLAPQEIRLLAVVTVSVLRYLDGTWQTSTYKEKVLRRALDDLAHLHCLPSLNQQTPYSMTVRAYLIRKHAITLDVARIQRDARAELPNHDVVFDVRLVALEPDGSLAKSYLLPWEILHKETGSIALTIRELSRFEVETPTDFDPQDVARQLLTPHQVQRVSG